MKRIIVGILAALTLTLGTAIGAGTATAGCVTYDEHNKAVFTNCSNGSAGQSDTVRGRELSPQEHIFPKDKEEPTEEPTDPETETPEGGTGE